MEGQGFVIRKDKVRSSCPIVCEIGGKVRSKEAETFQLCQLEEFSMFVVVVVSEGCVFCVEVSQNIDWHAGVVEEAVKACEGQPSVRSTVCRDNMKWSMLSGLRASLLCACLGVFLTMIATPSWGVPVVYLVVYPQNFVGLGGRPVWLRRTMSGSIECIINEITCLLFQKPLQFNYMSVIMFSWQCYVCVVVLEFQAMVEGVA